MICTFSHIQLHSAASYLVVGHVEVLAALVSILPLPVLEMGLTFSQELLETNRKNLFMQIMKAINLSNSYIARL